MLLSRGSRRAWKMHYQVTLEDGRQVGIFMSMKTGSWYYQRRGTDEPSGA